MSSTKLLLHMPLAYTFDTVQLTLKCDAIEDYYKTELDLSKYSWEDDDDWIALDNERTDIEDELEELFNTVIGFEHDCNPFKK